jgi:hypothetical protein
MVGRACSQVTADLQRRALRESGLPATDAAVALLRAAHLLYPPQAPPHAPDGPVCGDDSRGGGGGGKEEGLCRAGGGCGGLFVPHYRRFNRSGPGGLRAGDPVPASLRLYTARGAPARLPRGPRPCVVVAGSYT